MSFAPPWFFLLAFFLEIQCALASGKAESSSCSSHNLVDLKEIVPSILVELPYATNQNFTGQKLYPEAVCFVHRDVASALQKAQRELLVFGYGLKIWDGYRPLSLEAKFGAGIFEDNFNKAPKQADRHARGTAVNLTLLNKEGFEVGMPTPFDVFTEKTTRDYPVLSEEVLFHRTLLEQAMLRAGFVPNKRIWWHFDLVDFEKYPILDLGLEKLLEQKRQEKRAS